MLKNDRLLRAIKRQSVDCTPIWIMRQAGRYLPEYRQLRQSAGSFMNLCCTPELACAATLQPLARFDLDAAILFSDILTIPAAMGLGLRFIEGEGPHFDKPIRTEADIRKLAIPDPESELRYVMDAIRLIQQDLAGKLPLIGFAGSPWTLACYMVEGGASKNFDTIKAMLYREPQALHNLLRLLAEAVTLYLRAQIVAGVQVTMIFDTWGGILTPTHYKEFSLNYMSQILYGLKDSTASFSPSASRLGENDAIGLCEVTKDLTTPTIVFTKNGGQWLDQIAASGCDAVGLDWTTDIGVAREQIGDKVALQGNLEPQALYGSPERIRQEVARVLECYGPGAGHIFNLGHGILPDIPPENVRILVDSVHELSAKYHY